jgi:adenosine deaminase
MKDQGLETLPKVVLHDHLDGGLRPQTVLELAEEAGYDGLPASDPDSLQRWFYQANATSLGAYLEAFRQTLAVMQTATALERAAYEAVLDLAADGAVYAEIRFAPMLHCERGLTPDAVLDAVICGLTSGTDATGMPAFVIVDAMRQQSNSLEVARLAASFKESGIVGFDLAGPEAGFPASAHAQACRAAVDAGLHLTLHAGEGTGVDGVADALGCGAERLGHGIRIVEDTTVEAGDLVTLGPVAAAVRSQKIVLEICPSSNVHTGAVNSIEEHPIGLLHRAGFAVTLNTDNRLMSATSMSKEYRLVKQHHGFTIEDLHTVTRTAAAAAFCDDHTRREILERVEAGYQGR